MAVEEPVDEVDRKLATAVGLYALTDASLHEAADAAGVTGWELEVTLERAGLEETFGSRENGDVSATIDELFEES